MSCFWFFTYTGHLSCLIQNFPQQFIPILAGPAYLPQHAVVKINRRLPSLSRDFRTPLCIKFVIQAFQFVFVFLKKGGRRIPCPIRNLSVRQHRIQWLSNLPLVNQRACNAHRAGHIHLIRIKQNLRLYCPGLIAPPVTVGKDTFPYMRRKILRKVIFCEETVRLVRSHTRVAGACGKLFPAA